MKDKKQELSLVQTLNQEIVTQTTDKKTMNALLATSFKGFDEKKARQAMLEGMLRGYKFTDFLTGDVYAIPFGGGGKGYSIFESIKRVRKIAMANGQIGKSAPTYEMDGNKIVSCTVTVKRLLGGHIGEYTATVYFDEYDKGKDNWVKRPRTMIAKVAEMHALRMAFPDHLADAYIEDEFKDDEPMYNAREAHTIEVEKLKAGAPTLGANKESYEENKDKEKEETNLSDISPFTKGEKTK